MKGGNKMTGKMEGKENGEWGDSNLVTQQKSGFDTTDMTKNQERIFTILKENLDTKISNDLSLTTNLSKAGIDSIASIKMVVALESEFDFEFDDEMILISKYPTIKSLIDYVESKGTF
jgi:acyl carrier protein